MIQIKYTKKIYLTIPLETGKPRNNKKVLYIFLGDQKITCIFIFRYLTRKCCMSMAGLIFALSEMTWCYSYFKL